MAGKTHLNLSGLKVHLSDIFYPSDKSDGNEILEIVLFIAVWL